MVDNAVKAEIAAVNVENQQIAYLTLVALFILQEEFEDRENEWQLIAKKGKDYLKSVGVHKPDALIKQFKLKIVQAQWTTEENDIEASLASLMAL